MPHSFAAALVVLVQLLGGCGWASAQDRSPVSHHCRCQNCRDWRISVSGAWHVAESDNFRVWSRRSPHSSAETATRCEELRDSITTEWGLTAEQEQWHPKCEIVVHRDIAAYRRERGVTSNAVGCTSISTDDDRIVFRRIDLRRDAPDWHSNALPHELTHVVLADRFGGRPLPHWLNEGIAVLSESSELRSARRRLIVEALEAGQLPSLASVVALEQQLLRRDPQLSYSISASLVAHLEANGGREKLLSFVDSTLDDGFLSALEDRYPLWRDVEAWERHWLESLRRLESVPNAVP